MTLSDEIHKTNTIATDALMSNCCSHHGVRKRAAPTQGMPPEQAGGASLFDQPPFAV